MSPRLSSRPDLAPRGLKTPAAAGIAGLLFAALFTASILFTRSYVSFAPTTLLPDPSSPTRAYGPIVTSYLVPFAGIAFLWFIGVVRDRIGVYEDKFFSTVFLGAGVVFVTMLFAAASAMAALLTLAQPTTSTVEIGRAIARSTFYLYGARSAGVFTLVTSTIVLRTGAISRWAAFTGFAVGLTLLLGVMWLEELILLFPAWVALLSIAILVQAKPETAAQS